MRSIERIKWRRPFNLCCFQPVFAGPDLGKDSLFGEFADLRIHRGRVERMLDAARSPLVRSAKLGEVQPAASLPRPRDQDLSLKLAAAGVRVGRRSLRSRLPALGGLPD